MEGHGSQTTWRALWLVILLAGAGLLFASTNIGGSPSADPDFADAGEQMESMFRSSGQSVSAQIIQIFGGLLALAGVIGLARSIGAASAPAAADPVVVEGLEGAPRARSRGPTVAREVTAPTDDWGEEISFDPTAWDHPAGVLLVVDGRSAGGLYDVVRSICAERLAGSGLLVGMLQGLERRERKLVVVLGPAHHVTRFDEAWGTWSAAPPSDVDLEKLLPDRRLRTGAPEYDALRLEIKQAGYMVLAAVRA